MIEIATNIINFLGMGNVIAILSFVLATCIAFYIYFKTFYRLVYSTNTVIKDFKPSDDLSDEKTLCESRVIFYNNGRKTLTKADMDKLKIICSQEILEVRVVKVAKNLKTKIKQNEIIIDFDYLDSSDFFVLEIIHNGLIEVKGRVAETGKILDTETHAWLYINIIFLMLFIAIIGYNTYAMKDITILSHVSSVIIIFVLFCLLRYVHKLFFIPYKVSAKYLVVKDKYKWYKEFWRGF